MTKPQSRRFAFTKKSLKNLPAHDADSPSREADYTDSECIGSAVRGMKLSSAMMMAFLKFPYPAK